MQLGLYRVSNLEIMLNMKLMEKPQLGDGLTGFVKEIGKSVQGKDFPVISLVLCNTAHLSTGSWSVEKSRA